MMKIYKAKSHISLNVRLAGGGVRHVSFNSLTIGGSEFYTEDERLQRGLESHPKYGKLFKLEKEVEPVQKTAPVSQQGEPESKAPKAKIVKVPSLEDAKAYLVENFGISRTKLRSRKQIEDAGAANGIEFSFE